MSFTQNFEITTERSGASHVVRVHGELDSGTCDAVEAECRRALAGPRAEELTLDLRDVSFVDSAGMRMMIMVERSAREQDVPLVVLSPPEHVTALLRTAGVAQRVKLHPGASAAPRRGHFNERIELELPRDPMSPGRARAEVRELVDGRAERDQLGALLLLTSELVTNAVVHAHSAGETPIALRITTYDDGVRVEVEDAGPGFDPASPRSGHEEGGQGLYLVERCAARWGARRIETDRGSRFCVWFELDWSSEPTNP
jgi:anti-anti-sigma factor